MRSRNCEITADWAPKNEEMTTSAPKKNYKRKWINPTLFSHTLERKPKSFLCRQSRQIHCPKEAATWAELCTHTEPSVHAYAALRELAGHCECSASLAAFLPYMFASQMASSQETACLSVPDGTRKSPRATASYWHLGGGPPFHLRILCKPCLAKAWRLSSKDSLDTPSFVQGQMGSLNLSICELQAYMIKSTISRYLCVLHCLLCQTGLNYLFQWEYCWLLKILSRSIKTTLK